MHHSDRGSQYCSQEYRGFLERSGLRSSMSGKGNCFDNAPMESFWATLKQELVHHRHYRSRQEAAREITEYIELFYNRQRRQARLGFLSPAAYEQRFYAGATSSMKGLVSTIYVRPQSGRAGTSALARSPTARVHAATCALTAHSSRPWPPMSAVSFLPFVSASVNNLLVCNHSGTSHPVPDDYLH